MSGIGNIIQSATQTLDTAGPLVDPEKYLNYIQNQVKDIDPGADNFITEDTIKSYIELWRAKINAQAEQFGGGMM